MAELNTAANPTPAGPATSGNQETLLGAADPNASSQDLSILDQAGQEEKAAIDADNKRILEADDRDLSTEERSKKVELVKAQEESKIKADAAVRAAAVPEKYEIKPPEGMQLDQAMLEKAVPLFKEFKISNEGAQKFATIYAEGLQAIQKQQEESFKAYKENAKTETIKELGANYKQELAYAAKVRDRFLSPETVETLNAVGLANDVHLIKDLIKLGKLISEDRLIEGKREVPNADKSAAEVMYPDLGKK